MLSGSLQHETLGTDIIEGNLKQGITTHGLNGEQHTLTKGRMMHHIAFGKLRKGSGLLWRGSIGNARARDRASLGCVGMSWGGEVRRRFLPLLLEGSVIRRTVVAAICLYKFLWNFFDESRGQVGTGLAKEHTLGGTRQLQYLLGTCHADIAKTALLFQFLTIADGAKSWEHAFLHTYDKDHRKFQALSGVHGHHGDAVTVVF